MTKQNGFSLIELLIVIVIIMLIAALAIPNLLASRRAANEAAAASALRTLYLANVHYSVTTGNGNYAGVVATVGASSLADLGSAHFIDDALATGQRSSYIFVGDRTAGSSTEPATFYFAANPQTPTGLLLSGTKRFG